MKNPEIESQCPREIEKNKGISRDEKFIRVIFASSILLATTRSDYIPNEVQTSEVDDKDPQGEVYLPSEEELGEGLDGSLTPEDNNQDFIFSPDFLTSPEEFCFLPPDVGSGLDSEGFIVEEEIEIVEETDEEVVEESSERVITQEEKEFLANNEIYHLGRENPIVAMTYDDGGSEEYIQHIMGVYEKYGLRTTFFVTGQWVERNKELAKEMIERGFEIGCHGWDHAEMSSLSREGATKQIEDFLDLMKEIDEKYEVKLIRFPYGSRTQALREIAAEYGLQSVMWSNASGGMDEGTYDNVMRGLQAGDIVLSHSTRWYDVYEAEKILSSLLEQGYKVVTVGEGIVEEKDEEVVKEDVFAQLETNLNPEVKEILSMQPKLSFDNNGRLNYRDEGDSNPVLTIETDRHLIYPYEQLNDVKFFVIHYDGAPQTLASGGYRTVLNTINGLNREGNPSVQFCVDSYPVNNEFINKDGVGIILSQVTGPMPYKGRHVMIGYDLETGREDLNRVKTADLYEQVGVGQDFVDFIRVGYKDFDSFSLGVEQVGTNYSYNFPEQFPPEQQIANVLALIKAASERYGLSAWDIVGHHEIQEKGDPGDEYMLTLRYLLGLSYLLDEQLPDDFLETEDPYDYFVKLRDYSIARMGEERYSDWDNIYEMDNMLSEQSVLE